VECSGSSEEGHLALKPWSKCRFSPGVVGAARAGPTRRGPCVASQHDARRGKTGGLIGRPDRRGDVTGVTCVNSVIVCHDRQPARPEGQPIEAASAVLAWQHRGPAR
jgi:hypothetical protein